MKKLNIFLVLFAVLFLAGCSKNNEIRLSRESSLATESIFTKVDDFETTSALTQSKIYIYITGQVKKPGVYEVDKGSRLFHVVDMAGGLTKKAHKQGINLAEKVEDGQSIHIPSKSNNKISSDSAGAENVSVKSDGLININTATIDELKQLPGIGESKAMAILSYRDDSGLFSSIEDIKNVSGIGDSTFANIRDLITID